MKRRKDTKRRQISTAGVVVLLLAVDSFTKVVPSKNGLIAREKEDCFARNCTSLVAFLASTEWPLSVQQVITERTVQL